MLQAFLRLILKQVQAHSFWCFGSADLILTSFEAATDAEVDIDNDMLAVLFHFAHECGFRKVRWHWVHNRRSFRKGGEEEE